MFVTCENCGKTVDKSPSAIKHTKHNFCSRSCAAKLLNRLQPRRKRTRTCRSCPTLISRGMIYCISCNPRYRDPTLAELLDNSCHRASIFSIVRQKARIVARRLNQKSCTFCGYNKHVEVAHKKAISSFDLSTKLSIINHPDNLIVLCPNCHWEFDNLNTR